MNAELATPTQRSSLSTWTIETAQINTPRMIKIRDFDPTDDQDFDPTDFDGLGGSASSPSLVPALRDQPAAQPQVPRPVDEEAELPSKKRRAARSSNAPGMPPKSVVVCVWGGGTPIPKKLSEGQ